VEDIDYAVNDGCHPTLGYNYNGENANAERIMVDNPTIDRRNHTFLVNLLNGIGKKLENFGLIEEKMLEIRR
jgi:hypothetical protein